MQQAARGTQQVSANITDVQRGAGETGTASTQVLSSAQSLSQDSNRLKLEVGKFLGSVRAASLSTASKRSATYRSRRRVNCSTTRA